MPKELAAPIFHDITDSALAALLKAGAVGVLLTDTLYGVVGSARIPATATRVIGVKGRTNKPGTLIAANAQQIIELGFVPEYATLAERFWPGPVSVVLPAGPGLDYLHVGLQPLPVRVPNKPGLLTLLQGAGPLLTSSANRSGEPNIASVEEAQRIFGDTLDFYVDGGRLEQPTASTIIRIEPDYSVTLLRQGPVPIDVAQLNAQGILLKDAQATHPNN